MYQQEIGNYQSVFHHDSQQQQQQLQHLPAATSYSFQQQHQQLLNPWSYNHLHQHQPHQQQGQQQQQHLITTDDNFFHYSEFHQVAGMAPASRQLTHQAGHLYPPEVKGEDNCFVSPSIVGASPAATAATAATAAPPTSCVVSSSSSSDRSQPRKEEKGQKKGNRRPCAGADPTLRERVRKELISFLGGDESHLACYSVSGRRKEFASRALPEEAWRAVMDKFCRSGDAGRESEAAVRKAVRCVLQNSYQAFLSKRTKEERRRQLDGAKAMAEMAASGGGTTFPGATGAAAVASASAVSEQDRKEHLEWNSWTTWQ